MLVIVACWTAASPASLARSAANPAATVAAIGPATKISARTIDTVLKTASAGRIVTNLRGATGRLASIAVLAPSRVSKTMTTAVSAIWSSVKVTARAGSKSKRSAW